MNRKLKSFCSLAFAFLVSTTTLWAHDTWLQTGSLLTRTQDVVHVDVMLGNHGNGHRDFKISSKISLPPWTLEVVDPQGKKFDIKSTIVDTGYGPKEGFWSARFLTEGRGLYQVVHVLDTLHGKTRALKTSKTYVIAVDDLKTDPSADSEKLFQFQKNLELVLLTPVSSIGAGREIEVQIRHHGEVAADQLVTFIPRGTSLSEGFDSHYEKKSNEKGIVKFTPAEANHLLIVAHKPANDESGEGFDKTHYSATLALPVPNRALSSAK